MKLQQIDRRKGLTKESFAKEYLNPQKPVIFTDLMDGWAARSKWTIDFFKSEYGNLDVPVFSANYSKPGKKYMSPDKVIKFKDFLEILESGPTDLRMFLFNIFKHAPELREDYEIPTIMNGFINSFPFMFFGGESSVVNLHYDIDLSHVFLNQFYGQKKVILFAPTESKKIYHQPYTVTSAVDVTLPDFDAFPALKAAEGYECILQPGETLFMPTGYWHHITYLDAGYSISLRANESYPRRAKGLANIAKHYIIDKGMNKIMGSRWKKMKIEMASKRAKTYM